MADDATPQQTGTGSSQNSAQSGSKSSKSTGLFEKFDIPESVRTQYADLVPLILETESMSDDERQYWFQILPIMTEEQVLKLREILGNEKDQLKKLDKEYEEEMKMINQKHVREWKAFEAKEKRDKIKAAEEDQRKKEETAQEDLLKKMEE